MQTLNARQFRAIMPKLKQTLEHEHELLLVSNGVPVAKITPAMYQPRIESTAAHRASLGRVLPDSSLEFREERDAR